MTTEGPIQISTSADDAEEKDSGASFSSTRGLITFSASNTSDALRYNGGFRFNAVDIANGDTIDDVDMEVFMVYNGDRINCDIRANDVDDAVDFSSDADVTTRVDSAATSAKASWFKTGTPSGFRKSSTDDFVDATLVVQEVIDRGSWASGNDLVILLQGHDDSSWFYCECRSYDGVSSQAARLTIDFTAAGGGPAVLSSRRLLSGTGR